MSRSEDFDSEFWSDPDVAELSPSARYLYIWTWTNPRCNMSGAYQVTRALLKAETGLSDAQIEAAVAELEEHRFAYYDGRVVWVRSRVKRLRQKTPNIAKSIGTHLRKLPADHPYVRLFVEEYAGAGWLADQMVGLSGDSRSTVGDTPGFPDDSSVLADPPRLSPDSPRDGLGDGERLEGGLGETKPAGPSTTDVQAVFDAWTAGREAQHGRRMTSKLDDKRRRIIRRAIADHGLDDVLAAVVGWRRSPHHCGQNPTGTVYDNLGLLLRDADHVEQFRNLELAAAGRRESAAERVARENRFLAEQAAKAEGRAA